MPQYQISVPGRGTFLVESPSELTDAQAWQAVQGQLSIAPEQQSAFRQVADVPLGVAKGAAQGVRMLADVFGAGSDTSNAIKGVEGYLADLMSAQSKNDQQEIARIMKDAEDKGVLDQVKAGVKAFTVAPVDFLSQALGTAAPTIAAGLGATVLGAPLAVGAGVTTLLGAGMGAGTIKGSIYEETKRALLDAKVPEAEAEQKAQVAQEYGGKNLDQILLGTLIGGVASRGPLEKGAISSLTRSILGKAAAREEAEAVAQASTKGFLRQKAEAGALESVPEALQAGQEQAAQNIALQREGFDVPTFRGVAGAATLEGLAGFGLGTALGETARPPAPMEGQRPGETLEQSITRLQQEILNETQPPAPPPVEPNFFNLAAQPNGYGLLEQAKQQLLASEQTDRVKNYIAEIEQLQKSINTERDSRQAQSALSLGQALGGPPILSQGDIADVLANDPVGRGKIYQYKADLINYLEQQTKQEKAVPPELLESLQNTDALLGAYNVEDVRRRTTGAKPYESAFTPPPPPPPPVTQVDDQVARGLGFVPSKSGKGIYNQIVNKDLTDPAQLQEVRSALETYVIKGNGAESTIARVNSFLKSIPRGEADVGTPVTPSSGEGAPVAIEPSAGAAAPGVGVTQPSGVVPAVADAGLAPRGEEGKPVAVATALVSPELNALTNQWDQRNRRDRAGAWFDGGKADDDARAGFAAAAQNGGNTLPSHGMSKESTLSGGVKNLINLLQNGLDPQRGGGRLDYAPLVTRPGSAAAAVSTTPGGAAYSDGPFILVARPGQEFEGNLSGVGAVLVNQANAEIVPELRKAIQAIRPDILVEPYSNAGQVTQQLTQAAPVALPPQAQQAPQSGLPDTEVGGAPAAPETAAEEEAVKPKVKLKIVKTEVETRDGGSKGAWNVVDATDDYVFDTFDTRKEAQDYVNRSKTPKKSLAAVPPTAWGEVERRAKAAREAAPEEAVPEEKPAREISPETQQKIKQLAGLLKTLMNRFGLKDVGLNLVSDLEANGEYSNKLIKLALDAVSPVRDLRHESLHALKELGFFTPQQWAVLEKKAKDTWIDQFLKQRNIDGFALQEGQKSRYDAYVEMFTADQMNPDAMQEALIEEAISDAFGEFDVNKAPVGLMQAILKRMKTFFAVIKEALGQARIESAEDIFERVEKGELQPKNAWKATPQEVQKAEKYEEKNGIAPYISEGRLDLPTKLSIKTNVDKYGVAPVLDIPLNKDGTVTVYYHTTKPKAIQFNGTKVIPAEGRNRVYLTNESSGAKVLADKGNFDQDMDGSAVLLNIHPSLLQIDQTYPDGRKDFFVPLAQGDFFNKKMQASAIQASRRKPITEVFSYADHEDRITKALNDYRNLDAKGKRDRLKKARAVLKQEHNVGTLMTENGKLEKTRIAEHGLTYDDKPIDSMGLGLASAQQISDKLSTCPNSAICEGLCLGETSGGNFLYGGAAQDDILEIEKSAFRAGPRMMQYLKTEALIIHPEEFAIVLQSEIDSLRRWDNSPTYRKRDPVTNKVMNLEKDVYKSAVRLNVTSDFKPSMWTALIEGNPDVMFYDYTKIIGNRSIADNHHLTYSSTGFGQNIDGEQVFFKTEKGKYNHNWAQVRNLLNAGKNVAMAFSSKSQLPDTLVDEETGVVYNILDGDNYDARFLDEESPLKKGLDRGVIVGLRNKAATLKEKTATKATDGFFVDYDPKRDGDSVTVPDQTEFGAPPYQAPAGKGIPIAKASLRSDYDYDAALKLKWKRMDEFDNDKNSLMQRINKDALDGNEAAIILRLINATGFRVGNPKGESKGMPTFGATSLRPEHVSIDGDTITFDFRGKAGIQQQHVLKDADIAADLASRLDGRGTLFTKSDKAVRAYLSGLRGAKGYKIHDFRTWAATDAAVQAMSEITTPVNKQQFKEAEKVVIEAAARKIGDLATTARKSYVHPKIFEAWRAAAGLPAGDDVQAFTGAVEESEDDLSRSEGEQRADEGVPPEEPGVKRSLRAPQTEAFKRWFGDSKVVDENGEPLVVYHGTGEDFSVFKYNELKSLGSWFATDPQLADKYSEIVKRSGKSPSVMPVYLSMQNPANEQDLQKATEKAEKEQNRDYGQINKRRREILQAQGFDGVLLSDTFVVFDPTQIKSAIGNIGTYDITSPDIRKSLRNTNAKEFKQWFGNSQIVDEDGKPLVMYHGSARDITTFRGKQAGAIFLTKDPDFAEVFSSTSLNWMARHADQFLNEQQVKEGKARAAKVIKDSIKDAGPSGKQFLRSAYDYVTGKNPNAPQDIVNYVNDELVMQFEGLMPTGPMIYPVYVKAEKTFDYENKQNIEELANTESGKDLYPEELAKIKNGSWDLIEKPHVQRAIREAGFDSFYVKEGSEKNLAVYSSDQIKSAIGNVGAYGQRPITAEEAGRAGMTEEEAAEAQKRGDIRFSLRSKGEPVTRENVVGAMKLAQKKQPYMNCQLCVQMATGVTDILDLPKVNKAKIGDIYTFNERKDMASHYAVDVGNGNVAEIEGWGKQVRVVPIDDVVSEYDQPSAIRRPPDTAYTDKDIRFSLRDKLGMYSELENKIAQGSNKAPAASWKAYVNGLTQKGVKPEEIEWSGVRDWLDLQKGTVTKDDLLNYLKQGGVKVEETVLGGKENWTQEDSERLDDLEQRLDDLTPEEEQERTNLIRRENAATEDGYSSPQNLTKYRQYALPGGENYREVLLTLPQQEIRTEDFVTIGANGKPFDVHATEEEARQVAKRIGGTYEPGTTVRREKPKFQSSHWDEANVIAHIRLNDRTDADGNKVLFVEEIQSDWGQEGKKKGFADKSVNMTELRRQYDALNAERRAVERTVAEGDDADPATQAAVDRASEINRQLNALSERMYALRYNPPAAPFVTKTEGWLNLALKRIMVMAAEGGYDKVAFITGEQSHNRFPKKASGESTKESFKAFYDTIVPIAVKKLLPKVGGEQMTDVNFKAARLGQPKRTFPQPGFDVTSDMKQKVETTGLPRFSIRDKKSVRNNLSPATKAEVERITTARYEPGFVERITKALAPESFSKFRAQALNRYNQLSVYDKLKAKKMGGVELLADQSAEAAALMSDLGAGVTAQAMGVHDRVGGIPVYRKGYTTVSNEGGTVKGIIAIFAPLAKYGDPEVYRDFQFWAGSKRGKRFLADGKEQLYTPANMKQAQEILKVYPEFESIFKEWTKYNEGLVKYMVDTGVISAENGKKFVEHSDYIPFYRQIDGETTVGPNIFQSISGVKAPKKLKGGEQPLADFLETIVRNTQASIQAGLKNVAAQRAVKLAEDIGEAERLPNVQSGVNVVTVLENGMKVSYDCRDHLFINAVKSLNLPDLPFIGLLAGPANLLRNLVTKDPGFMLANMMRDSMSAMVTSGVNMTPIVSTIKNFGTAIAGKSPEYEALLKSGVLGGYDYSAGVEQSAQKLAQELRKEAKVSTTAEKLMRPATWLWEALEKGTEASDAATRIEVYKQTLKETGNEAEAIFRSLEVMNFNRKGSSAVIRIATAAIPFLNARMQGLDILYRAAISPSLDVNATERAKRIQKTFFVRGMTIAALSCMYWMMTHDDDEYKKQEQETRDNYWLFPGLGIKIPIPFEVGIIFKVIPERIMAYTFGDDTGKDFMKSMKRNFENTLPITPMGMIPQLAKPYAEVTMNYSLFTGRPIIGQGMETVDPKYQSLPMTATFLKDLGEELNISPIKMEYLIRGYTGTMGAYMVDAIDSIYNMHADSPKAAKRFEQMPVLKRFAIDPDARGSVTAYYDLKNATATVVRTSNYLERSQNYEEYAKYLKENIGTLAVHDYVLDMGKTLDDFNEYKQMIRGSKMDAEKKREALLQITRVENQLTANIQQLRKMANQ